MSMKNGFMAAAAAAALLLTGCASQGTTETGGVSPASACASGACEQPVPVASCKGMSACKTAAGCKGYTKRHHKKVKPVAQAADTTVAADAAGSAAQ